MKKIGIISDTHGFWDEKYEYYLNECDEIWHAGDIGSTYVADKFEEMKPKFRAVYGNCDGTDLRCRYPELLRFKCENINVMMKHIGGYPGKYDPSVKSQIIGSAPDLFISGHSHILKVMNDRDLHLLHINPGAAGHQGWQLERTVVRLTIDGNKFEDLEIIKLGKNNSVL
jgi:putative phosphoesterase